MTATARPDVVLADYNNGLVVLRTRRRDRATTPGAPTLDRRLRRRAGHAGVDGPVVDGGSPITGYNVYRGTAGAGGPLLASVGATSGYTDTTAVNGTLYTYEVSAVNAIGEARARMPSTRGRGPFRDAPTLPRPRPATRR